MRNRSLFLPSTAYRLLKQMTQSNQPTDDITIYSTVWCPDCKRAKKFFSEHRIAYVNVDIEEDAAGQAKVEALNNGMRIIPTIVFPDGDILVEPSNAELAEKFGMQTKAARPYYDVIIAGGGPAGLTAALYLSREGKEVLVIEQASLGGQAGITQTLDNFPGFDEGISGEAFAQRLSRQARKFGAELLQAQSVTKIERDDGPHCFCVFTGDGSVYSAKAVLLTTGAKYRRLDAPGEETLIGTNIHFCATCDGAFYKGKKVLVIGGGNSAFEESLFLTKFATQVDIVHRSDNITASAVLREKVARQEGMTVILNHAIESFNGENKLESISVRNNETDEVETWHYDGVFVFIGLSPNNDLVKDKVELDPQGFVITSHSMMTSMPGLFAAGDVRAYSTKQAASAVGEGAAAAVMMSQYLMKAA